MTDLTRERPPRSTSRGALAFASAAAALVLTADVLRWMIAGPLDLRLLGTLLPPENRMEAEACLGVLLAAVALVASGAHRRAWGPSALVAALTLAVCLADLRPIPSGDTATPTLLPFALLRNGKLTFEGTGLDGPVLPLSSEPLPYFLVRRGDRIASLYPPAMGLLVTPVIAPAALGRFDARSEAVTDLGKLAAAALTALGVTAVYAASRRLVGPRVAKASTLVYVLGTPVLSVLGQAPWLHTGATVGFSVAILSLVVPGLPALAVGGLVGLGSGIAIACRPVDLVLAAGAAAALIQVRPRAAGWMVLAGAVPLALLALYQWRVFGSPLSTSYGAYALEGWTTPPWKGIPGLLVSPGRGLFVESPILLVAAWALIRAGRGTSPRWFGPAGLGLVALVCVLGCWFSWWGGFSPGNRMLSDGLPLLGVALACGLADAWRRPVLRAPIAALAVASVATFLTLTFHPLADPFRQQTMSLEAGGPWVPVSHPLVALAQGLLRPAAPEPPR